MLRHGVFPVAVVLASLAVADATESSAKIDAVRPPRGALIEDNIRVSASVKYGVPSPDGRNLYKVEGFDGRSRVVVIRRDMRTGGLVELPRDSGCSFHCAYADGLNNPVSVAVTPDGLDVIVSNRRAGLSVYRRDRDGSLRMRSCIGWRWPRFECSAAAGIGPYPDVAVSPDGRHLYVVSMNGQRRLTLLTRDGKTGRLKAVAGPNGCFLWAVRPNDECQYRINRGFRPIYVTVSPDGNNVYVSSAYGFYVFQRDASTGELSLPPGPAACYVSRPTADCTRVRDIESVLTRGGISWPIVAVPRDGHHAYVGRRVFKRDLRTGALTLLNTRVPDNISFSSDGRTAYQTGRQLRVYRRTVVGALKLLPQPYGILRGRFADHLVVTPDGRHVYATEQRYVSDPEKVTVYRVAG